MNADRHTAITAPSELCAFKDARSLVACESVTVAPSKQSPIMFPIKGWFNTHAQCVFELSQADVHVPACPRFTA